MDEILDRFGSATLQPENRSQFDGLYKNWGRLGNQDERRRDILDAQKNFRNSNVDTNRGIYDIVNSFADNERHEQHEYRPTIYVAGFTKVASSYKNVLMMSEWMIEKPWDFEENWTVSPCPKGVRMLVVAAYGVTKFYTKYGQYRFECPTTLPGGNPCESQKNHSCVLDGFYVKHTNTFYVIDLLAWNHQSMTDGESDFRQFWLVSHLEENASIKVTSHKNDLIFSILPKVKCDKENFTKFMMKYPHFNDNATLDGLLFYHKQAQYCAGETPMVGWLYPYMVPEILGLDIPVNPAYMIEMPIDYVNQADFIEKFEQKHRRKSKSELKRLSASMDTADFSNSNNEVHTHNTNPEDTATMEVAEAKKTETTKFTDTLHSKVQNDIAQEIATMELVQLQKYMFSKVVTEST